MKTPTNLSIVLSLPQLKEIVEKMEDNKNKEPALSDTARFILCNDTDCRALRIDNDIRGIQMNSYQECGGMSIQLNEP